MHNTIKLEISDFLKFKDRIVKLLQFARLVLEKEGLHDWDLEIWDLDDGECDPFFKLIRMSLHDDAFQTKGLLLHEVAHAIDMKDRESVHDGIFFKIQDRLVNEYIEIDAREKVKAWVLTLAIYDRGWEYQHLEFCKDVKCPIHESHLSIVAERCNETCILRCLYTYHEFHRWLQEKGYAIKMEKVR